MCAILLSLYSKELSIMWQQLLLLEIVLQARPNQPQQGYQSLSESDTITHDQSASYRIPRDTYITYFNVLGICILLGVYGVNYIPELWYQYIMFYLSCSCKRTRPLFSNYYSSTHIFIKPGSLVGSTMHDGLLPLSHVSFQILNLEGTLQKPGVDLLVEGLGHANDDTIWISPPNVSATVL